MPGEDSIALGFRPRHSLCERRPREFNPGADSGGEKLLKRWRVAYWIEVSVVSREDSVALVFFDCSSQMLHGRFDFAGLGIAAGEQEIHFPSAVLPRGPLRVLDSRVSDPGVC